MTDYLTPWYDALGSAGFGMVYTSDNPEVCKQRLYAARAKAADPALEALSIVPSPTNPAELWIIKRKKDAKERGSSDREGDAEPLPG